MAMAMTMTMTMSMCPLRDDGNNVRKMKSTPTTTDIIQKINAIIIVCVCVLSASVSKSERDRMIESQKQYSRERVVVWFDG